VEGWLAAQRAQWESRLDQLDNYLADLKQYDKMNIRPSFEVRELLRADSRLPGVAAAAFLIALIFPIAVAHAQDLEPRAYSDTPVGLNFLIAGYTYSDGKIAFDPTLPIADAQFHSNTEVMAYAHSLNVWGDSAKFDVTLPYSSFSGHALVGGRPKERDVSGLDDPRFRFSLNFYGAPALSLKEFAGYRQDLIVGASLSVTPPLGQYDYTKLLNLGNNRWSFKPELGISKAWGQWTVEILPSVTFYTDNTNFYYGRTYAQAPDYALQVHVIYGFMSGIWLAADGTYFTGNRTTVDGVRSNNLQTNTRGGLTLALPVNRYNSVKIHASTGTSTRTGSTFNAIGILWQHRWGGGL
jgi:hypothetical protein